MGAVLQFAAGDERARGRGQLLVRSIATPTAGKIAGAEIVIFPGVRYERLDGGAGSMDRGTRSIIERDRLELID